MNSRTLLLTAPSKLQWKEQELPPIGRHDLLVETRVGAISLGTELPRYRGDARGSSPASYPAMTGYESLGTVLARGAAVQHIHVGERVVSFYGHQTHAVIPADRVTAVPEDVSDEVALLVILTGDVANGLRKLVPAVNEAVLVTGAGAIGLLAVWVLKALGAPAVDVIEPQANRRTMALRLGARNAIAPEDVTTLREPYATGIECSSRDSAFTMLQEAMGPQGRVCVLSDGNIEPLTLAPAFHERELTIVGSSDCPDYASHARWYFPIAGETGQELEQLFDLRIPSDELPDTFARLATGTITAMKALVRY